MPSDGYRLLGPGCARLVGFFLFFGLGLVFFVDIGIGGVMCMDSQDGMCAWRGIGAHVPLYLAGVGVIALVMYVVRRRER